MAGKFNQVLEDYKRRAEAILDQKDKVSEKLNEALQKLLTKSPKAQAFFDDLKDFIQMISYWVEGKLNVINLWSGRIKTNFKVGSSSDSFEL